MSNKLISVIIPTFSRPIKLKSAIDSILNQTYKNIEIIIVDDNNSKTESRFETEKVVQLFKSEKIIYIKHDKNLGANAARNTGIYNSKGDYIAFLDDDDEFKETKIEDQLKIAEEHYSSEIGVLVFVGAKRIGDSVYKKSKWMNTIKENIYFPDKYLILSKNYIGSNSYVLVDRISLLKIKAFDISLPSCQDWDLFIRLALNNVKFIGINKILVTYNNHENLRITNDSSKRIAGHMEIKRRYERILSEINKSYLLIFYRYLYYQFINDNKKLAKQMLHKLKENSNNPKDYIKYVIDISMLLFSRFPTLYQFIRKTKNTITKGI